jgi:serine/threonine protein kinase
MTTTRNWTAVTESKHAWEREALEFVRARFPAHDPYRAWSNFEFIADDGSINEVDLLVFTPQGFFLIEIKSRSGRLFGDAGTWTWETDGRLATDDNPLIAANLKAKKLRKLLENQKVCKNRTASPFVEALVFCSAPNLNLELQGNARFRLCLRDRDADGDKLARPGIMAAITRRQCPGLEPTPKGTHDRPMAKLVSQAMEQAGIRPSQRYRKVSDYVLNQIIAEGPGYQDWRATHSQVAESVRRVRLYLVSTGATADERQTNQRAALREFQLLETLQHPGVLKAYGLTEHEVGPALTFEHDPLSIRLDHYLTQRKDKLSTTDRLDLVRQIAEVMRYAHDKKVVHRSLCPQSILVTNTTGDRPRIKVYNWQVGYRVGTSTSGVSRIVQATSHVDRLVEDASTAYMAPEALTDDTPGEHLDVFSLGALAYHVLSGVAPARNGLELSEKLRETKGLPISSVLNGASESLQFLIQFSTHPEVSNRIDSVVDFLEGLDAVEKEQASPEHDFIDDPDRAQIGDRLPGGFSVVRRLGQGACSVALLVDRQEQEFVLKVASDPDHNARLKDEADVLRKVRHSHVVEFVEALEIGNRAAFLMRPVFAEKDKRLIETLGQRLRKEGRLHIDLLQRFGEDLLGVVSHLEEQGIPHRDIKPDNIAVGMVGRGDKLHLVLFDFSLSRTPADNIRAGTNGYLDPLLPLRKPPRWDLHAERYAAAMTLYELATGSLPKWGDGATDPSHLSPATEITVDAELFDPGLREPLSEFFRQAFRRDIGQRFDNAEEMLRAWRLCFQGLDAARPLTDVTDERQLAVSLDAATFDTPIPELGLGTRATNVLDRANILTVEDLLGAPVQRLHRLRGVGSKTRREITMAVKLLRERLGIPTKQTVAAEEAAEPAPETLEAESMSVDLLADRIHRVGGREGETVTGTLHALLGLNSRLATPWPSQAEIAQLLNVTRGRIGQIVPKLQARWSKLAALTALRDEIDEILSGQGGVMSVRELTDLILVARGSSLEEPQRSQYARAVVRAAVEVERGMSEPKFLVRRSLVTGPPLLATDPREASQDNGSAVTDQGRMAIVIAHDADLANYAFKLGEVADRVAAEDPLLAPPRVLDRLREVTPPATTVLADSRLIRLAAEVSANAAVSSRQELYPRGMSAARALKLSQGALLGLRFLTVQQIRERVGSRYPDAAPLPDRPELDELLTQAGFDFRWDDGNKDGPGCYVSPLRELVSVTSGSESVERWPTTPGRVVAGELTPEEADARQFEERLHRAIQDGSFLALLVNPKYYERATSALCRHFPLELIDFEGVFLDALVAVASQAGVKWDLVLKTDATPHRGDWDKLLMLVARAMPAIEQRLLQTKKTMLVIYPGPLARYEQMDLLARLSQKVGRRDGIPGLWLLLPGDHQALLDGKPVPLMGPGQRTRIPESWIANKHREDGPELTQRRKGAKVESDG